MITTSFDEDGRKITRYGDLAALLRDYGPLLDERDRRRSASLKSPASSETKPTSK
ncbi:MAG: hypothetical protein ACREH9_05460 [Pseudomonadota bacterium]